MSELYRRGNTVGPRLKNNPQKALEATKIEVLESLKLKTQKTRLLLDYFTVTITPKKSKNDWDFIENIGNDNIKKFGKYDFRPKGKIKELSHDEFFNFFIDYFGDLFDFSEKFEETKGGGGDGGYNYGRIYKLGETSALVHFKTFNPENSKAYKDYSAGSPHNQFVRQKVMFDLSGDALQYLRSKGRLLKFILRLYKTFPVTVTKFDIAMDYFNYNLTPKYFADLYQSDYYTGLSKVNGTGDIKEPTVYIGAYKGNETVMLYDKILESKDKNNSDEPELLKLLEDTGGDWFRLEQHYSNDKRSAEQAFGFIVYTLLEDIKINYDIELRFIELMSSLLYKRLSLPRKPRFLSQKRRDRNNSRIPTDRRWQLILDEIEKVDIDFAYERPELTLQERMDNYKYKVLGGTNLFNDVMDELGFEKYIDWMNEVTLYHVERRKNEIKMDSQ